METNQADRQKRTAVEYLSFGAKTAKRVTWEAWEFSVVGPHLVEVTNASYGFEKDDHAYVVGVEGRDGVAVPAECECPADMYREDYDCKHKVALATVGGPTVLNAAVEFDYPGDSSGSDAMTARDGLKADGGTVAEVSVNVKETCPNGDPGCDGPDGDDLPCFECYCDREEAA